MINTTDTLRGEVLVAIMNNKSDFAIAREEGWYRIPVVSADRFLRSRWPPKWLAFYQTKVFEDEAYADTTPRFLISLKYHGGNFFQMRNRIPKRISGIISWSFRS